MSEVFSQFLTLLLTGFLPCLLLASSYIALRTLVAYLLAAWRPVPTCLEPPLRLLSALPGLLLASS